MSICYVRWGWAQSPFLFSAQGLILATAELAIDEVMGRQSSSKGGKECKAKTRLAGGDRGPVLVAAN